MRPESHLVQVPFFPHLCPKDSSFLSTGEQKESSSYKLWPRGRSDTQVMVTARSEYIVRGIGVWLIRDSGYELSLIKCEGLSTHVLRLYELGLVVILCTSAWFP